MAPSTGQMKERKFGPQSQMLKVFWVSVSYLDVLESQRSWYMWMAPFL